MGGGPLTAPPQSAGHSDDELLFSGMVSRWLFRKGARWVERFDVDLTADREEPEFINGAFGEQTLVDVFKFRAAAKLGPAIIYARALPHPDTGFDVSDFFAGNLEVEKQLSSDRIDLSGETPCARVNLARSLDLAACSHLVSARCCSRSSPRSRDRPSQEKKQEHDASSHGSRGELGCPCSDRYDNEANP